MLAGTVLTTRDAARRRLANAMAEQAERIGARLTEARLEQRLTRSQMAARFEESSVTDDYIYRWETGRVMPSEAYQGAIIEHYRLDDLADLFGGPKAERQQTNGPTPDLLSPEASEAQQVVDRVLDRLAATQSKLDAALAENADLRQQLDALGSRQEPPASAQK